MPYRIKSSDDNVQAAFRRIADEQIGRALGELADDGLTFGERIHQVRKRCKKVRGLLRLFRSSFDDYSDENGSFRDAARLLSEIRDAKSLVETVDAILEHFSDELDRDGFAPLRDLLTQDAKEVRREADTAVRVETFRRALTDARERAAGWELEDDGFDAVAGGLRKTFKRARKAMQEAWADPSDEALHEWRKRVKYHWYHIRLLREINPEMMLPREARADELSDLLGDHHDLAVLQDRLEEASEELAGTMDLEAFGALVRQRKDTLQEQAFELGRVLFEERSKALVKRWRGYWEYRAKGKLGEATLFVKP